MTTTYQLVFVYTLYTDWRTVHMKRFIAKQKSTKMCICCGKSINKGAGYYAKRILEKAYDEDFQLKLFGQTVHFCTRCGYYEEQHNHRFQQFKKTNRCKHPITDEVWGLMAGEDFVQEPKYTECLICGKTF